MIARTAQLAGIAAVLPAGAGLAADPAPVLHDATAFVPPAGPLLLTRVVRRELHGGKEVVATRRYRLQFEAVPGGFRVVAALLDIKVDAPPVLQSLAEIERQRSDDASFELKLDSAGQIIARDAADNAVTRAQLARQGEMLLATSVADPRRRAQAGAMLGQLLSGAASSALPADIFNPNRPEQREHRVIALPDGSEGEIDVLLTAEPGNLTAAPRHYARTVVTALGGSRKVSREEYTIAAE